MIYFDSAATSFLKPPVVSQAVFEAMQSIGSPGRGAHPVTLSAARTVYSCREAVAKLFGLSNPGRVCFTQNSTTALNIAINGVFRKGDHVITTALEHNSVLRPLYRLQREKKVELTILPADEKGQVDLTRFPQVLQPNTRGIVCTHASNVTGNTLDLKRIGEFCKENHLYFVVDASQSAGVLPIHMEQWNISLLCFTGHKGLLGPQGTGGLCVAEGIEVTPLLVGGSGIHSYDEEHPGRLPEGLEAGTLNAHGIAGLLAGISYIEEQGQDRLYEEEMALAKRFLEGIRSLPGVKLYGKVDDPHRTAVISLNLGDEDAAAVADVLAEEYGICVRAGAHCAPLMHKALGTVEQGAVRFSFSHMNTTNEIDIAVEAIRSLCARLA